MEILELIDKLLRQYRGTKWERCILAVLEIVQDNVNLNAQVGTRINPGGQGIGLDLLGDWLGLPRPIIPDLFQDYWGFRRDPVDPDTDRKGFNRAPFADASGDVFFRAHAGDTLYRAALRGRGRQLRLPACKQLWLSTLWAMGLNLAHWLERYSGGPRGPLSRPSTAVGDAAWHAGTLWSVSADSAPVLVNSIAEHGFRFAWPRTDALTGRAPLPAQTVGLGAYGGRLYAVTQAAVNGAYLHVIDTETFAATPVTGSQPAGLPALQAGLVISATEWLAADNARVYTCTWGSASAITHTDAMPAGTHLTSFAQVGDEIWALDRTSGTLYRRNAQTRAFSQVSTARVYDASYTGTPWLACSGHAVCVIVDARLFATPVKLLTGHRYAVCIWIWAPQFGMRSLIDTLGDRLLPQPAGIPVDYDFYYPT